MIHIYSSNVVDRWLIQELDYFKYRKHKVVILLFGVSCVGKTTIGEILSEKLKYKFFDLDKVIRDKYKITQQKFVDTGTIRQRDEIRGEIIEEIIKSESDCIIAVTPMSNPEFFVECTKMKNVISIELIDLVENIFQRTVFSNENDVIYKDDFYKNLHKDHYMNEIEKDLIWYGHINEIIKNKFFINNMSPEDAASKLISTYNLI